MQFSAQNRHLHIYQIAGVEPTFRWVVRKPERKTVELIWSLLREKKPLQFGVEKLNKRKGSRMYTISNTILRLQD